MTKLKLGFENGVFYCDISLRSSITTRTFRFMVDTGASDCVIGRRAAESVGFDIESVTEIGPPLCTASGFVDPKSITLEAFEALGCCDQNFRISVVDFPDDTDGVIGNTFLKRFGSIKFNYPDSVQAASIEVGEGPIGLFGFDVIANFVKKVVLMYRRRV